MPRKYIHSPSFTPKRIDRVCRACGAAFTIVPSIAKRGGGVYCSFSCKQLEHCRAINQRRSDAARVERTCAHCGAPFTTIKAWMNRDYNAGTYCSIACSAAAGGAARTAASKRRKESERERRKEELRRACVICGVEFIAGKITTVTCSPKCSREQKTSHLSGSRTCPECEKTFDPQYGHRLRRFCSDNCASKHNHRIANGRRKAKKRSLPYDSINPLFVFEHDGWRCRICGCSTPRSLRGTYEPNAPELDHIIPLSKGGHHVWTNVQCLCRACNLAKSDHLDPA